jgi:hypothetical protein
MKEQVTSVLSFISQLISSLAWPATVLICAMILKPHLRTLILLLRSVKYSEMEIKFGEEVAALTKSADKSEIPHESRGAEKNEWGDLTEVAKVRPRTAIRISFVRIEESMAALAHAKHIEIADGARGMPMVVGALLLVHGAITEAQYELLSKLRNLVEEASNSAPDAIGSESAAEFVSLAQRFANSLQVKGI